MVRLALLIVSLLGMFVLNACGSNNNSSNIDAGDAPFLQKGQFSGELESAPRSEAYNPKTKKVETKSQTKVFKNSKIDVDWDSRTVRITTELYNSKSTNSKKSEPIILEGSFNSEGIAYLFPVGESGKNEDVKAGVDCTDSRCEKLRIDLGARVGKPQQDGTPAFLIEQMNVKNPNPLKDEIPASEEEKDNPKLTSADIMENMSSGYGAGTKSSTAAPKSTASAANKFAGVTSVVVQSPAASPIDINSGVPKYVLPGSAEDDEAEAHDDIVEGIEPGVPALRPFILMPEMKPQDGKELKLGDYYGTKNYPYELGEKYSGKAEGRYDRGSLKKGTDVAVSKAGSGDFNIINLLGFSSVIRSDRIHYGSGLLVRLIEEVGKIYERVYPGDKFRVGDLSKKAGGRAKPHESHQNGMDVDISIPKSSKGNDYGKLWTIIDSFAKQDDLVDIIFLHERRIKQLCTYLQSSGIRGYQEPFKKLYKDFSYKVYSKRLKKRVWVHPHDTHIHVRAKCTPHNNCRSLEYTNKSKFAVCK